MQEPFVINNRYLVNPERNSITDRINGEESRIEQRLLEVLNLLAASPGELVSRDKIASNVWNDYGGADEGLTQAISFLRKALNDRDKKIIETIPKKGYLLNAVVLPYNAVPADGHAVAPDTPKNNKGKYVIGVLAVIIIVVIIYLFTSSPVKRNGSDIAPQDSASVNGVKGADIAPDTTTATNPDMIPDSLRGK